MQITTSSDEQYRIIKMINGNNGMSYHDALDEEIDNAIDEFDNMKTSEISIIFKDKKVTSIYNNGRPMSLNDRKCSLTLDGRSKKDKDKKKGKYGIGGASSRARLAGQGSQIITSRDGNDIYRCEISLKKLAECDEKQCWTADHEFRPKWSKVNDESKMIKYKQGVTKEYIGDDLNQTFCKEDIIKHLTNKYNRCIKDGLKIYIKWDDENIFTIPDIISNDTKEEKITIDYHDNGRLYFNYNDNSYQTFKTKNGYVKTTSTKERKGQRKEEVKIGIRMPSIPQNSLLSATTKNYQYIHRNNNTKNLFQNIDIIESNIELRCNNNSLIYKPQNLIEKIKNIKDNKQGKLENYVLALKQHFIPDITIHIGNFPIACKNFIRKIKAGGDFNTRYYNEFIIDLYLTDSSTLVKSQENKNIIEIPDILNHAISKIIALVNTKYKNEVKKEFESSKKNQQTSKQKEDTQIESIEQKHESPTVNENTVQEVKPSVVENTVEEEEGVKPTVHENATDEAEEVKPTVHENAMEEEEEVKPKVDENIVEEVMLTVTERTPEQSKSTDVVEEKIQSIDYQKEKQSQLVKAHHVREYRKGPINEKEWKDVYTQFMKKFLKNGMIDCAEIFNIMVKKIDK